MCRCGCVGVWWLCARCGLPPHASRQCDGHQADGGCSCQRWSPGAAPSTYNTAYLVCLCYKTSFLKTVLFKLRYSVNKNCTELSDLPKLTFAFYWWICDIWPNAAASFWTYALWCQYVCALTVGHVYRASVVQWGDVVSVVLVATVMLSRLPFTLQQLAAIALVVGLCPGIRLATLVTI